VVHGVGDGHATPADQIWRAHLMRMMTISMCCSRCFESATMELLLSTQMQVVDWPGCLGKVGPPIQNPRHHQLAILLSHHTPWQRLSFALLRDRLLSLFTLTPSPCGIGRVVAPLRRSRCLEHAPKPPPYPGKQCFPHLNPTSSSATRAQRPHALLEPYCSVKSTILRC
jgi:hypothetical protein